MFRTPTAEFRFDPASAFELAATVTADSTTPEGGRQRYQGWPDSARARFQAGDSMAVLMDKYVAGALIRRVPFAVRLAGTTTWLPSIRCRFYDFSQGTYGESHHIFSLPDGTVLLDLVVAEVG